MFVGCRLLWMPWWRSMRKASRLTCSWLKWWRCFTRQKWTLSWSRAWWWTMARDTQTCQSTWRTATSWLPTFRWSTRRPRSTQASSTRVPRSVSDLWRPRGPSLTRRREPLLSWRRRCAMARTSRSLLSTRRVCHKAVGLAKLFF